MADEVVDLEVARQKMRQWREEPIRNSEEVVELGECLILEHGNKLGDELWTIYEQVFLACLDCNKTQLATMCLKELNSQFPDSVRVKKLKAMRLESVERYDDASALYRRILEQEPANTVAMKRQVAIHKAQNKPVDAIKELTEYLKKFMSDQEAWLELVDLYIAQQDFKKARYSMEEVLLSNPHNHLFHQKYAEILYTIGDLDSMEKSKKYFLQALKLDNNNMRALYGVFLSASHLATASKDSKAKRDNTKLSAWAGAQVMERYQGARVGQDSDGLASVEGMLDLLQISAPQTVPPM